MLRPGSLSIAVEGTIVGTALSQRFKGDHALVTVATQGGGTLELELRDDPPPEVGTSVRIAVDVTKVDLVSN